LGTIEASVVVNSFIPTRNAAESNRAGSAKQVIKTDENSSISSSHKLEVINLGRSN
jgi:hypothetical protein